MDDGLIPDNKLIVLIMTWLDRWDAEHIEQIQHYFKT